MVNRTCCFSFAKFEVERCTKYLFKNEVDNDDLKHAVKLKAACRDYINMFNNVFDENEETL